MHSSRKWISKLDGIKHGYAGIAKSSPAKSAGETKQTSGSRGSEVSVTGEPATPKRIRKDCPSSAFGRAREGLQANTTASHGLRIPVQRKPRASRAMDTVTGR